MQMQKVLHLKDALKLKKPKLGGMYMLTEKIEGIYTYFKYDAAGGKWSTAFSSANRNIPAFQWMHYEGLLAHLPKSDIDTILIAEAYIPDLDFPTTNGIFNRSTGDYYCKDVVFALHDLVQPSLLLPAGVRSEFLKQFYLAIGATEAKYFSLLPILATIPYDEKLWKTAFEGIINKGGEGIVAKRADSIYSPGKRNSDLLKLKHELTVDLLAVRLEEGFGEKGFPSLTLVSRRANGVEVRTVISKHKCQELFRATPEAVIGKVVEIRGMEEYVDGTIRHPVFLHIRHDKNPTEID